MGSNIKRIAIIGSTGSIGQQTLDVVRALPRRFRVIGLAAGKNIDLLARQVAEFQPEFVSCSPAENHDYDLQSYWGKNDYDLLSPEDIASHPDVDTVVIATSGKAGLSPTLSAIKAGKKIALANKEVLVMAGEIATSLAKSHSAQILPVDSEHSAIWQCLRGETGKASRLILTASGGPFADYSPAQMEKITVEQALAHPSWNMGRKVTIDSATLMNKGLEVIEAHWLFDMPFDDITVIVHPQSIVHSMVEFADGSIKAQLSYPDMRLPIQYALSYPERLPNPRLPTIDWTRLNKLSFKQPDPDAFPCLKLAIEAGRKGGTYPAVLCGADEVAVSLFLGKRVKFVDIAALVEQTLEQHQSITQPALEEILEADIWARSKVLQLADGESLCRSL